MLAGRIAWLNELAPDVIAQHCEYNRDFTRRFLMRSPENRNKARKDLPQMEAVLEKWISGGAPYVCVALHRTMVEQIRQLTT